MREVHYTPLRIIVLRFTEARFTLSLEKAPAGIHKCLSFSCRSYGRRQQHGAQHNDEAVETIHILGNYRIVIAMTNITFVCQIPHASVRYET